MRTIFTASRLFTPVEEISNPLLSVEDGQIVALSSRSSTEVSRDATLIDFGDTILAPGFFDIHIHGGGGIDAMLATPAELPHLGEFLARHGVTSYFPTTVTAPLDATYKSLDT